MSVRLREVVKGRSTSGTLTVPAAMMHLGLESGMRFVPEFTKDGILFRYVGQDGEPPTATEPPSWLAPRTNGETK